jgi:hypothetical protein
MVSNLRNEVFRSCLITSFQVMRWDFHVSSFYSPDFKLHEVFKLYFTPFRVKIWNSHILLDILCNEELLINRAGVVKRLETCLSSSSAFNLFLSFNYGTLKIMNRGVPVEGIKKENNSCLIWKSSTTEYEFIGKGFRKSFFIINAC